MGRIVVEEANQKRKLVKSLKISHSELDFLKEYSKISEFKEFKSSKAVSKLLQNIQTLNEGLIASYVNQQSEFDYTSAFFISLTCMLKVLIHII